MRLNLQTDYALRLLMHLAANSSGSVTIAEVANRFRISHAHLMKVAYLLGKAGFVQTIRGRAGGMRLARPAADIGVGDVLRQMEGDIHLVECFGSAPDACVISRACRLKSVLNEAVEAFLGVLDQYTLADLSVNPRLQALLRGRAA